jgi:arabinogalactan oligomer/maltooligosaccharide transport system permease protein
MAKTISKNDNYFMREEKLRSKKKSELTSTVIINALIAIFAFIWIIPILWLLVTAFSKYRGIDTMHFFPAQGWTLDNFKIVLFEPDSVCQYVAWFKNTFIIATFSCIISTAFVLMVSYAFSCMRFKGRHEMMKFSIILNMFPGVLSMIAVYFVMKQLGLTNSHIGMVIVYSAGAGLGYLICKGFMDTIPTTIREAARLDGASEIQIFFRIILPLSKPIIVYTVISAFLAPWADFVFAKLMLNSGISSDWTVAIGLYNMLGKDLKSHYFSIFCAGGLLISIPISVLFMLMQKYYVEGVTGGASKG